MKSPSKYIGGQGVIPCSEILPHIKSPRTECSNGTPVEIVAGTECSNRDPDQIEIMPKQALMPPPERSAGATDIGGGTESCVDDWNPGDSRSIIKVLTQPGINPKYDNKEVEIKEIKFGVKKVDEKYVVLAPNSTINDELANENTYKLRNETQKLDMQSPLQDKLSTTPKCDNTDIIDDDNHPNIKVESKDGRKPNLLIQNDENDEFIDLDDDENDNRDEIKGNVSVRAICDKIEGGKRRVKRNQVRLSPKSKPSPLSKVKKMKKPKNISKPDRNDEKDSIDVVRLENNDRKIEKKSNKVGDIIAAIENKIKKGADVKETYNDEKKVKAKVENAFQKLMDVSIRGDTTPSPGIKKRRKRIGSLKSHGTMKLDEWLKKEK